MREQGRERERRREMEEWGRHAEVWGLRKDKEE